MSLADQLAAARVFDLEQPRFAGMPLHPAHKPGYFYALHRRHRDSYRPEQFGPRSGSSGVLTMMEHSGTHIDALCHMACDLTMHGGVKVEDAERADGYSKLGAETMKPLLGRGVLLDVAALKGVARLPENYAITDEDLIATAKAASVTVKAGDVLLVRTGYATAWETRRPSFSVPTKRAETMLSPPATHSACSRSSGDSSSSKTSSVGRRRI